VKCEEHRSKKLTSDIQLRKRRARRYKREDIRCAKHADTKACRSTYISQGRRRCNWCVKHRADGSLKPTNRKRIRLTTEENTLPSNRSAPQLSIVPRLKGVANHKYSGIQFCNLTEVLTRKLCNFNPDPEGLPLARSARGRPSPTDGFQFSLAAVTT
jgi:hypothetical protein